MCLANASSKQVRTDEENCNGAMHDYVCVCVVSLRCFGTQCSYTLGMVGYVESLTDPSYEGQILVLTYPMVGNYGVPARPTDAAAMTQVPPKLQAPFESTRIHVAGLVVAYYSHDFSHYLAASGLSDWLKIGRASCR